MKTKETNEPGWWLPARDELPELLKGGELMDEHAAWSVEKHLSRLEAENAELREALELCLSTITKSDPQTNPGAYEVATLKARRALEGKP